MARTYWTPGKSTRVRPLAIGRTDRFYDLKPEDYQSLDDFLEQFQQTWSQVTDLGVSELDGILRLVHVMPALWQGWASTVALDHINFDSLGQGTFLEFVAFIREQNNSLQSPPPGWYPVIADFLPTVRQLFDLRFDERRNAIVLPVDDPPPVVDIPLVDDPMLVVDEGLPVEEEDPLTPEWYDDGFSEESVNSNQVVDDSLVDCEVYQGIEDSPLFQERGLDEHAMLTDPVYGLDPSMLDLYGQPFALNPTPLQAIPYDPSVEMFDDPPLPQFATVDPSFDMSVPPMLPPVNFEASSSRPPGVARSHLCEPGFVETVGTWTLERLAISELSFVTDPYLLHPELMTHASYTVKPPARPPIDDYEEDELEPLQFAQRDEGTPAEEYGSDIAVDDGEDREQDFESDGADGGQP